MTKTFLSVDIDYWNYVGGWEVNSAKKAKWLEQYLKPLTLKAKEMGIPISAVMNHQQMLDKVNTTSARRVVNVDTHSDLADTSVLELNCGTWFSYVRWRHDGEYEWVHAGEVGHGDCNTDYPIFTKKQVNRYSDWGSYNHKQSQKPPEIEALLDNVVEMCVCSSPAYSMDSLIPVFYNWRKEFNIPYTKGIAHEQYGRKITPPHVKAMHVRSTPYSGNFT